MVVNYCNTSDEVAQAFAEELAAKYHVTTLACKADVSDDTAVQNMLERVKQEFSALDILVNNAGIVIDKEVFQNIHPRRFRRDLSDERIRHVSGKQIVRRDDHGDFR